MQEFFGKNVDQIIVIIFWFDIVFEFILWRNFEETAECMKKNSTNQIRNIVTIY